MPINKPSSLLFARWRALAQGACTLCRYHGLAWIVILIAGVMGITPLLQPQLYSGHDIWHQVARGYHYYQAVSEGIFPPLWIAQLANHYGYPLFFFSYHLPWIVGLLPYFLTGDLFLTIRILFGSSFVLSGFTMYLLAWVIFRRRLPATVAALLYLWVPYRFITLYVSVALGTAWVFPVLPLLVLGIWRCFQLSTVRDSQSRTFSSFWLTITIISLSAAALLLSHLLTVIFFVPALALLFGWMAQRSYLLARRSGAKFNLRAWILGWAAPLALGGILALGIAGFYLSSSLGFAKDTTSQTEASGFGDNYKTNFVAFTQLLYSKWGFSPIVSSAKDGEMSFQVGIAQWLCVVLAAGLIIFSGRQRSFQMSLLSGLFLSIFLMTDGAKPWWDVMIKYLTLDYPFRFVGPTAFVTALLAGSVLDEGSQQLTKVWQLICQIRAHSHLKTPAHDNAFAWIQVTPTSLGILSLLTLVTISWFTNRNHVRVNKYDTYPLDLYVTSETTTNTYHEYLPRWTSSEMFKEKNILLQPPLAYTSHKLSTSGFALTYNSPISQEILVGQFFFPGMQVTIDGQPTTQQKGEQGRLKLLAPAGVHRLAVQFSPPPLVRMGQWISLISLLILAAGWLVIPIKSILYRYAK